MPLSPWASAMLAGIMALLTYAFLKKYAGRGMMALVGAVVVGGLTFHADRLAYAMTGYLIESPSGSVVVSCGVSTRQGEEIHLNGFPGTQEVSTNVPGGVTLNRVTPVGWGEIPVPSLDFPGACKAGTHIPQGGSCLLPCDYYPG